MKFVPARGKWLMAVGLLASFLIIGGATFQHSRQSPIPVENGLPKNCHRLRELELSRDAIPDTRFCLPETKKWRSAPSGAGAASWQSGATYLTLSAAQAADQSLDHVIRMSANELRRQQPDIRKIEAKLSETGLVGVLTAEIGQTNTIYLTQVWVRDVAYHVDLVVTASDSKPIEKMVTPDNLFPG